jgi:N-acetylmuramic acid 6-phosphate etherase
MLSAPSNETSLPTSAPPDADVVVRSKLEAMANGLHDEIQKLKTESQNSASARLDTMSALEIARVINEEDKKVGTAVERALPKIAEAIDAVARAIGSGGRLIYVGAGTSGRIAALDASECPPTFNVGYDKVQFVMAGGTKALWSATEASEDDADQGRTDIRAKKPGKNDVVAGLAASGRTPYTVGAIEYARSKGAVTVAITCNPGSPLGKAADVEIVAEVGPEALSGSTRMKAGTAQKLICNMITTGAMARLGYVYGNLMINVQPKNAKLVERAIGILETAADVGTDEAAKALKAAANNVPVALIMLKTGIAKADAQKRLMLANGNVRHAIEGALPLSQRRASRS